LGLLITFFGATIPPNSLILGGLIGVTYGFRVKGIKRLGIKFGKLTTYPYNPLSCGCILYQIRIPLQAYHNIGFWGIGFTYGSDRVVNTTSYQNQKMG
jgi:hypothetical protein